MPIEKKYNSYEAAVYAAKLRSVSRYSDQTYTPHEDFADFLMYNLQEATGEPYVAPPKPQAQTNAVGESYTLKAPKTISTTVSLCAFSRGFSYSGSDVPSKKDSWDDWGNSSWGSKPKPQAFLRTGKAVLTWNDTSFWDNLGSPKYKNKQIPPVAKQQQSSYGGQPMPGMGTSGMSGLSSDTYNGIVQRLVEIRTMQRMRICN